MILCLASGVARASIETSAPALLIATPSPSNASPKATGAS